MERKGEGGSGGKGREVSRKGGGRGGRGGGREEEGEGQGNLHLGFLLDLINALSHVLTHTRQDET